jgi:N-acetyltransferase 10
MGLQHKTVDDLSKDLDLAGTQLLGLFNRTVKKLLDYFNGVLESALASNLDSRDRDSVTASMVPMNESLADELGKAEKELMQKQQEELARLKRDDLSQYSIKGSEQEWSAALSSKSSTSVSIKVGEKRIGDDGKNGKDGKRLKVSQDNNDFGKGWKKSGKKHPKSKKIH